MRIRSTVFTFEAPAHDHLYPLTSTTQGYRTYQAHQSDTMSGVPPPEEFLQPDFDGSSLKVSGHDVLTLSLSDAHHCVYRSPSYGMLAYFDPASLELTLRQRNPPAVRHYTPTDI